MEAAIVLPVVILAVITSVLIIMFFYSQMTERCRLHMALREEAGRITGQTHYIADTYADGHADMQIYSDKKPVGGTVHGKKYLIMEHSGILDKKGTFTVEGSWRAADGTDYIRYRVLTEGIADEQTD